jgi:type IV pilus assembly protein PilQ
MVPNPQITIDGVRVERPSTVTDDAPPLLPRAIAPPVGDIAVSSADASPTEINLGTNEVVPRLVLRDAPVRDVLSLLARAAGLNVAYVGDTAEGNQPGAPAQPGGPGGDTSSPVRVSLDIENEPVQNVFNYVIRIANLDANRVGRTIFVGPRLPNSARDVIVRTLRLNQVNVASALNFLVGMGAETAVSRERQVASVLAIPLSNAGEGQPQQSGVNQVQTTTEQRIEVQRVNFTDSTPVLRGLQVIGDERTNSLTLVGTPRQIELAAGQLVQLDVRRRQVAVNVKVVDVNLLATEDFNTSFSFGVGNTFVSSDNGAVSVNFGGTTPPTRDVLNNSSQRPPITAIQGGAGSPIPDGIDNLGPFQDSQPNQAPYSDSTGNSGSFFVERSLPDGTTVRVPVNNPNYPYGVRPRAPFGTVANILQPGVTDIADDGALTIGLPQLFRYPTKFLAALQAQVVSGNAKILTDPTLVVQEGQTANVVLAQDVVTNVSTQIQTSGSGPPVTTVNREIKPAGLSLALDVSRVDDNGFVTLQVNPSITSPGETQTVQTGLGGTEQIVLLSRRDLQSGQVRLRDGQTLILSGIIQETDRSTVTKVPILGDIPILGALFRSTQRDNRRQEVIVLLTPHVLDDSDFSTFGYRYTPSQDAQEILQRHGVQVP